jgi:hypothetical protein
VSLGITRKSNQQTRMNGSILFVCELSDDYQDLGGLWRTWVAKFEIGEMCMPMPLSEAE